MVPIHRDADARGRDVLCTTRGADAAARGHDEAARKARTPRGVPALPSEGRGCAGGPSDRRPDLRRIGRARLERRVGDASEGARTDEASQPRPANPEHPGGVEDVRADRGNPRSRLDESASTAPRESPRTGVRRRAGRAPEERVRGNADWRERGRDARRDRGCVGRGPGLREDRPHVPRGPGDDRRDRALRRRGRPPLAWLASPRSHETDARGDVGGPRRGPRGARRHDGHRIQAGWRADSDPSEGRGGEDLQSAAERCHVQPSGDRRDREIAARAPIPAPRRGRRGGHEGLMAKQLESTYSVGKRGKKWFKIKPADHLDLAITAAEWGSGRREGWLSNYWLAVRDDKGGGFQMIGKTFKGLTDAEFQAMTERLRGLATSEERWGFHVRPETVVEVAYNEIQRSPHYPSGFALRFARIVRIRDDKGPQDVDTYERLKDLYAKQFERKGRGPDDL